MKKILIISFSFPPIGGGAIIRIVKFTKYLPEFDWIPIIFTSGSDNDVVSEFKDSDIIEELPSNLKIYRSNSYDPIQFRMNIERKVLHTSFKTFFQNIKSMVSNYLLLPDKNILWVLKNLKKIEKIIYDQDIKYVLTTSPPNSINILGLLLKKRNDIKWIADFRDPWYLNPIFSRNRVRILFDKYFEKLVVRHCDLLIANTNAAKNHFDINYNKKEIVVIPNGYDEIDFNNSKNMKIKNSNDESITFTYAGSINISRIPDNFIKALQHIIDKKLIDKNRLKIIVFSTNNDVISKFSTIREIVKLIPPVSYRKSIELIMQSDVLIELLPDWYDKRVISSKLYNYLYTKKPILAIIPKGEGSKILKNFGDGLIVEPSDFNGIVNAIKQMYDNINNSIHENNNLNEKFNKFSFYNRKNLTKILVDNLNEL